MHAAHIVRAKLDLCTRRLLLISLACLVASLPLAAGELDASDLSMWQFRQLGPAVTGGRITSLAVSENDRRVFFVATASGNLWKTSNYGTTFEPLLEDAASASIGAVALAPSDPKVVWVGTGEANNRQSSSWGSGVYRSTDGGRRWTHLGLEQTRHIGRIVVHPDDPETAYIAALGHLWGPNPERGVYRTRDGGRSWERILYRDQDSGAVDLVMDPGNPGILYAALYQRRRTAFGFNGGGSGSGIYKTLDGGDSWQELTQGLPPDPKGRIGLSVYRRDGQLLYTVVEAAQGGIFRSRDGGRSWQRVNTLNPRPMYFSKIRIDPNDSERIFLLGRFLHISENGGRTFVEGAARGVHPDHHDLWIDPSGSNRMILGGDGGLSISFDGGSRWRMIDNLPIAQVYKLGVDMREPYYVYAGLQDNGTWAAPSRVRDLRGLRNADWVNIHSGDGFAVTIDPDEPSVVYAQSQRGRIVRVDMKTGERQRIQPLAKDGSSYRWNWSSPLILSRHSPRTLYAGANRVLKSGDRGLSWVELSPDLTSRLDRSLLDIMGAPESRMLSRHDGVAHYGTITSLEESPLDGRVLYAGTDDGRVQTTRDGGLNWSDLTPRISGAPQGALASSLTASSQLAGRVYVTLDNHRNDDYLPYVFASDDFGLNWRSIRSGLGDDPVNVLIEHPRNPQLLFLGSESGLYLSVDEGGIWHRMGGGLPTVAVDDLLIHPRSNDLIVGTHGRGVWILDDITPLQEWDAARQEDPVRLFSVREAVAFNPHRPQAWDGNAEFAAANPPLGARIRYRVAGISRSIQLDILDSQGRHVRRLKASDGPGMHESVWDLRLPVLISPQPDNSADPLSWPRGPRVMPGRYSVRLQSEGRIYQTDFAVTMDPEVDVPQEDLRLRQDLLLDLHALQAPLYKAQVAAVRAAEAASKRFQDAGLPHRREASQISRSAVQARHDLRRHFRSARALFNAIEGTTARPTSDQVRLTRRLFEQAASQVNSLNLLLAQQLSDLYRNLNGADLPSDLGTPIEMPRRTSREQ